VAGCDVLHIKRVVQRRDDLLDVRIARHDEVKAARDQMDARVDRAGRGFGEPALAMGVVKVVMAHPTRSRVTTEREIAGEWAVIVSSLRVDIVTIHGSWKNGRTN
jgi:hypothetical protein